MYNSIKLETPCEFINIVPCNPLISKCQIKVCYVGEEPNRNRSIITKEVATEMANSLPGSPIVGYYNEAKKDFEEHNRAIDVVNGKFRIKDTTRPYGFVDLGAKCWFQKFDDNGVEHEYLMTEGYIWTGQYPETKRIIDHGNNQSMELDENSLNATWTKDSNGESKFFIINEAIISKLCILGEEFEPCFEGSNITRVQFSFEDDFKKQLRYMIEEVKKLLNEGGTQVFNTYAVEVGDSLWSALYSYIKEKGYISIEAVLSEGDQKFAVVKDSEEKFYRVNFAVSDEEFSFEEKIEVMEYEPSENPQFSKEDVEAYEQKLNADSEEEEKNFKKKEEEEDESEENKTEDESDSEEDKSEDEEKNSEDEDKEDKEKNKKNKYTLEEIPEYTELLNRYNKLEQEKVNLESQIKSLTEFKKKVERKEKEHMIEKTFYMLSEEDKADVIKNIDSYSLREIEAELSIICFRNKVSFADLEEGDNSDAAITYNLNENILDSNASTPAWVQAVLNKTANNLN